MNYLSKFISTVFFSFFFLISFAQTNYEDYLTSDTIFIDNFSNNKNKWPTGLSADSCYNGKIVNGAFELTSTCKDSYPWYYIPRTIDILRDFEIEANILYVKGENDNAISLIWGKDDNGYRFNFGITGNGQYKICRYNGSWFNLKDWTASDLIHKSDYNKLTVRKIDTNYYFFLNEKLVHTCDLYAFFGNQIGFQDNKNTTIRVDYLKVSYLKLNPKLSKTNVSSANNAKTVKAIDWIEATLYSEKNDLHIIFDFNNSGVLCLPTNDIVKLDKPSVSINPWTGVSQGNYYVTTDDEGKSMVEFGIINSQVGHSGFYFKTFKRKGFGEKEIGSDDNKIWSIDENGKQTQIGISAYENVTTPEGEKTTILMHQLLNSNMKWTSDMGGKIYQKQNDGHLVQVGWVGWRVITPIEGGKVTILMTKGLSDKSKWTGRYNGKIYQDK
jgi:hypothetical protein